MPKGKKYRVPLGAAGPKTGRRYGAVRATLRNLIDARDFFAVQDFVPPLTHEQSRQALKDMARSGEIVKYESGIYKQKEQQQNVKQ